MSLDVPWGCKWNGRTDRQRGIVPKRRGARVKSSCSCVGLHPRDRHNDYQSAYKKFHSTVTYWPLPWSEWCKNVFANALVFSRFIIAIQFCLVLQTLTSPNFNVFRLDWPVLWQSHHHSLAMFHCYVPLKFRIYFKICLLICTILYEKTTSLSSFHTSHSHSSHWDQTK